MCYFQYIYCLQGPFIFHDDVTFQECRKDKEPADEGCDGIYMGIHHNSINTFTKPVLV